MRKHLRGFAVLTVVGILLVRFFTGFEAVRVNRASDAGIMDALGWCVLILISFIVLTFAAGWEEL